MTMLALGRGNPGTANVLVADTLVGRGGGDAKVTGEQDKLSRLFGRTYVALSGDTTVLDSLTFLIAALDPQEPALDDPRVVDAVLTGAERLRTLRGLTHNPVAAVLLVCSAERAFYWNAGFEVSSNRFTRPTAQEIAPGRGVVVWGRQVEQVTSYDFSAEAPYEALINAMAIVDEVFRKKGGSLGYTAAQAIRHSGVVIPHDPTPTLARLQPFKTVPERMALHYEKAENLNDKSFTEFPKLEL